MNIEKMEKLIDLTTKRKKAELVYKNISILDVFTLEIYKSDVAINDGIIIGIGNYEGVEEIDGSNLFITPTFIDAHMHLESTLVTLDKFEEISLKNGVTTVVVDPHEIANVSGEKGIEYIINSSRNRILDINIMLPSCVPATSLEKGNTILTSKNLKKYYKDEKVFGLAEVMDLNAILSKDKDMLEKLSDCMENNKIIDGHLAGVTNDSLDVFSSLNILTDHECSTKEEALSRLRRGMYVLIREGTAAKNLEDLVEIITIRNSNRICFCTDDKHLDELIEEGSIDNIVRKAIKLGVPTEVAYQMASLNSAQCYNLEKQGAIAPGYKANFLILSDLEGVKIEKVYKDGKLVVEDKKILIKPIKTETPKELRNTVNIPKLTEDDFKIEIKTKKINTIKYIPNRLETEKVVEEVEVENIENLEKNIENLFNCDERDLTPIFVIDRYSKDEKHIGKGILKNFNLKETTIATTISHDSHNIIAVGKNRKDLLLAVEKLEEIEGGIVVVRNGEIKSLQLEIGGLISERSLGEILLDLEEIHEFIKVEKQDFNPFLALSFLSLPVIPEIKMTTKGYYSIKENKFLQIEV